MRRGEQLVDDVLSDADAISPQPTLQKVDRHYSSLNEFNMATSQLPYMKMVSLTDKELMRVQSSGLLQKANFRDGDQEFGPHRTSMEDMETGGINLRPIMIDEKTEFNERPEI